jgi:hypothetical protein
MTSMPQRPPSPRNDLLGVLMYAVTLGAVAAAGIVACRVLLDAMPSALASTMRAAETTGAAATSRESASRAAPWRMTPAEVQKRFEQPSLSLLPPPPMPAMPAGWAPSYAAMAKAHALEATSPHGSVRRRPAALPRSDDAQMPRRSNASPATFDTQLGGR